MQGAQLGSGARVARGEEGDLVAARDQAVGEHGDDQLGAPVAHGGDAQGHRG
ncbi:hypothetical protein D3C87_1928480 [compost metagenome]